MLAGIGARVEAGLQEIANRTQAFDSLYGLLALARSLEPVRGRKSIVYFAEAREVPDSVAATYDTTIGEANRANVTIHTVDTRGLQRAEAGRSQRLRRARSGASARRGARGAARVRSATPRRRRRPSPATAAAARSWSRLVSTTLSRGPSWQHIANDTGGLAIADTNDLGLGLGRVVEELGQYYEVVYAPPNPVPDGRFRRIEAKVSRRGVNVRTRAGYFATPAASAGLLAYEMPLLAALGVKTPSHDFGHHASVLHFGVKGREREALFLAQVPLSDVRFAADEARGVYRAHLTLLGLVKDEAGRPVARITHDWPIEGPLAEKDRVRRASTVFRRAMTLPAGRYTLETAVQDRETGALSVERSGFAIAEAPPGGLALGSLSIVRRAEAAAGPDAADPLRVAGVVIHPELGPPQLTRSMPEIPLFLPVYPSLAATSPEIHIELLRDGQPVAQARPPLPAPEPDGRIAGIFGLPAKPLAPGRYEIVATVRQGDVSAEERTAFEVREATGAPVATAAPPPVPADLVPVLERAARYVLDYEQAFHDVAAEENYTQWAETGGATMKGPTLSCTATSCRRLTRADVVFVRLGGEIPWGTFRDVFEVDGQKVRDREGRLEKLFGASTLRERRAPRPGDPRRERALQHRPRDAERQLPHPCARLPPPAQPAPLRVEARGHASLRHGRGARGGVRGGGAADPRGPGRPRRPARDGPLLDRPGAWHRAAERDAVPARRARGPAGGPGTGRHRVPGRASPRHVGARRDAGGVRLRVPRRGHGALLELPEVHGDGRGRDGDPASGNAGGAARALTCHPEGPRSDRSRGIRRR